MLIKPLLLFLISVHAACANNLRYVNVHKKLESPFFFIAPDTITFFSDMRAHSQACICTPTTGKIPAHTSLPFSLKKNVATGFVKTQKGFVLYDSYTANNPTQAFLGYKHARSISWLGNQRLTATLSYMTANFWQISIKDNKDKTLFTRKRSALSHTPLTHEDQVRIGLHDIVLHNYVGSPIGWAVILDQSIRFCIPYKNAQKKLSVWSEGVPCISAHKTQKPIIHTHKDYIDIWHTHTFLTCKNAPLRVVKLPVITRIHLHRGHKPCHTLIPPPNKLALWPKAAQEYFSNAQKYLASVVYSLPILKETIMASLKDYTLSDNDKNLFKSLGFQGPYTQENLRKFKKPPYIANPFKEAAHKPAAVPTKSKSSLAKQSKASQRVNKAAPR